ncbi:ABC transporter substrate-binding protein [Mesorhizobium sp. M7A.F.Ca.US.011.01.1.1]|uniref:ABC transporter substrate-binding protein n=1 Tax=Mesorhizobium sp. M7A.F.Ca.US.011.01.1.1 TaxID=2496741 RepID=UPI0013E29F69|nr:ABC transporter substrate-binding protein [Mesorhizobium sp. M7A.F.Ca.US.011.01.1.1]
MSMKLSRRSFIASAAGAAVVPLVGAGRALAQSASGSLTLASYGGGYQDSQNEALVAPFLKQHPGISVINDTTAGDAKVRAMVESGQVTWDLVTLSDGLGFDDDGQYLEEIDYNVVPRDRFLPGFTTKYRVGATVEASNIAFRGDAFEGRKPAGFADFFDLEKFPGKRAVYKYVAGGILEAALVADGVDPSKLFPLDVERALKKLDSIKSEIIWWESGAQSVQLLVSGEASMGILWVGRAVDAASKAPVEVLWAQWLTTNGFWGVPKGAPNKELAMQAIASFTGAESQKEFSRRMSYGPTNKDVVLDQSFPFYGNYPTQHLESAVNVDFKWWRDNQAEVDRKFQQWLIS